MKITADAAATIATLRTRYFWAVANNEQVVVALFNYSADAKAWVKTDPENLVAFDASGVVFEVVKELK